MNWKTLLGNILTSGMAIAIIYIMYIDGRYTYELKPHKKHSGVVDVNVTYPINIHAINAVAKESSDTITLSSDTPNISIGGNNDRVRSGNSVSLGNITDVGGNIEIDRRTSQTEHVYNGNGNVANNYSGMSLRDVDILLRAAKKDMRKNFTGVMLRAKNKFKEDMARVKTELNKYLTIRIEEALKLSTEFTDKSLRSKEKYILDSIAAVSENSNETIASKCSDFREDRKDIDVANNLRFKRLNLKMHVADKDLNARLKSVETVVQENGVTHDLKTLSLMNRINAISDFTENNITSAIAVLEMAIDVKLTALLESLTEIRSSLVVMDKIILARTHRTQEVFWFYGEECPLNSIPLNGSDISGSTLAYVFDTELSPDYSGRFIRNITSSGLAGTLEDYTTSSEGLYITHANVFSVGISDDVGEHDGSKHHWLQGGYGIPTRGYFVDPDGILAITSAALETRPINVSMNLCMHE